MSENTERDTHFAGFAKLLWDDIGNELMFWSETSDQNFTKDIRQIIARRAYDLVEHILKQTPSGSAYIRYFKDMDVWPDNEALADALAELAKIEADIIAKQYGPDMEKWPKS